MSESYKHVVKGGLKLKGGAGLPTAGGVKKKKKKKKDKELGEVRGPRRPPPPRAPTPPPPRGTPSLTTRIPSPSERARGRRGDGAPGSRGGGPANGGGAAVRRADGEAAGEDRGEDGEQEPSRQSRRLQRLPLEAQRAPRHPEGRARVTTITREESVPTLVRVTADHRVASRGRSPSFPRRGLDPPLPTRSRAASRRFADASTSSGRFFTRPRRRPRRPRSRCPRPLPPSARTRRAS